MRILHTSDWHIGKRKRHGERVFIQLMTVIPSARKELGMKFPCTSGYLIQAPMERTTS